MMVNLSALRGFIDTMDGDEAEISKASLVAIERELSAARRALAGGYIADGLSKPHRRVTPASEEAVR